ncbi:transporter substrate-binding domain-containing protein, partial [Clostridium saudiense]|nr:transporter substrate-binding domain-containing protein [Clostridium saudiense]
MNYNTIKNILKNFNKVILILSIINICLNIQCNYINAETNNKIKVGYSSVSGFTEVENDIYSGLGFEYLREIAKYTGWEYEFIEMSTNDMINKLKDGEIDIAGAMLKNDQTIELYDFPEYN